MTQPSVNSFHVLADAINVDCITQIQLKPLIHLSVVTGAIPEFLAK